MHSRLVMNLLSRKKKLKHAHTFPGSVSKSCPDIAKARRDLKYEPLVGWWAGVESTVNRYLGYLESEGRSSESFHDQYGIIK